MPLESVSLYGPIDAVNKCDANMPISQPVCVRIFHFQQYPYQIIILFLPGEGAGNDRPLPRGDKIVAADGRWALLANNAQL
jgi:hypothetical protein